MNNIILKMILQENDERDDDQTSIQYFKKEAAEDAQDAFDSRNAIICLI
jgi:hypothetical protein